MIMSTVITSMTAMAAPNTGGAPRRRKGSRLRRPQRLPSAKTRVLASPASCRVALGLVTLERVDRDPGVPHEAPHRRVAAADPSASGVDVPSSASRVSAERRRWCSVIPPRVLLENVLGLLVAQPGAAFGIQVAGRELHRARRSVTNIGPVLRPWKRRSLGLSGHRLTIGRLWTPGRICLADA